MMCGGCVGRVKRLLEGHESVSLASVNLATETALVRVALDSSADVELGKDGNLMALGGALAQVRPCLASARRAMQGTALIHAATCLRLACSTR